MPRDCIGLVTSRAAVGELLKLDHLIDLVIPRGSGKLVNTIKVQVLEAYSSEHRVTRFYLWQDLGDRLF